MYEQMFASMDDKAFHEFMLKVKSDEIRLAIIAPNLVEPALSVSRNLDIAELWGHNFFERIWIDGGNEAPVYLSNDRYLIIEIPLRRQSQLLVKKMSVPTDSKSIDDRTGQVSGKSQASRISYPELQVIAALELDNCATELMKYRGGDIKGADAMNDSISKTGRVSMDAIAPYAGVVESTKTLSTYLTGMHLSNALAD